MTNEDAIANLEMIRLAFVVTVTNEQSKIIYDTFKMAIDALKSRWIPVSDRVPEDDRLVIVCTEWGYVYTDYYFEDNPEFWQLAHIIAWQDLPKAYKKEDSNGKLQ